jgi:predicted permease
MSTFLITLFSVGILLLSAVPGYLFIKCKMVKEDFIPGVSKILVYICQPAIAVYSFAELEFSLDVLGKMGLFTLLVTVLHILVLIGAYFAFGGARKRAVYGIITVSSTFANCTFFGIPIIEVLLPDIASSLIAYAAIYSLVMNIIGWTVGAALISGDVKYISLKKVFLNPATISTGAAFLIFLFGITIPEMLLSAVTVMGKMATPLSMLVLGMRLASIDLRRVFCNGKLYISTVIKQFLMPVLALLMLIFIPMDEGLKACFFILAACPTASVVLAFAEMLESGQEEASGAILLSTILSIVSLPLVVLLMVFI